jgi:ABC-type Fe3+/spermidine/putrescine transport system ATPase subunit
MQRELKQIQRQIGTTFIFVTHDQNEAVTMSDAIAVMNDGRIEQIGAPLEIYDRPQTRFVANFIGNTNMLEVSVEPYSGGRVMASLGNLTFECIASGGGSEISGNGHVSLRYEQIKLGDAAKNLPVELDAKVISTVFSGSVVQYELAVQGNGGLRLIAELHHDGAAPILQDGETVKAGWAAGAARYYADG